VQKSVGRDALNKPLPDTFERVKAGIDGWLHGAGPDRSTRWRTIEKHVNVDTVDGVSLGPGYIVAPTDLDIQTDKRFLRFTWFSDKSKRRAGWNMILQAPKLITLQE